MIIRKRQPLGIGLDKTQATRGARPFGLGGSPDQHFMAKIGTHHRHPTIGRPVIGQRQVAGAGADVEDGSRPLRRDQPGSPPAPVTIDIEAQQVIEQIVARRDVVEHAPDTRLALVEQRRGHDASSVATAVGVVTFLGSADACGFAPL